MTDYKIILSANEETVVSNYEFKTKQKSYQSEAALEDSFIADLTAQGYTYLNIHTEKDLINNLRTQLEKLNDYKFTDNEWDQFFKNVLANKNISVSEKTEMIQVNNLQLLKREDGSFKNIMLIDKKNPNHNFLQVINQYTPDGGNRDNRYDVTILVNGFPMVHIELKRRGVALKEAFNQIKRYQRDSFWADSGLYEYVQIFVISNGTYTKYYSNSTRYNKVNDVYSQKKHSDAFEFTMYWSTKENRQIRDLVDFTATFFAKRTLLNILTKYCVFTTDKQLMVMRPYQIAATEAILNRILIAYNYKYSGSIKAGGFIWHAMGSGKTLTSFKTAQLVTNYDFIDKVLFVVDRKDLDYQTVKEYDKFQKGAADSNTSTKVLQKQLEDPASKIIVTTIQKLSTFVKNNPQHDIYKKQVVIIFDECHRSQFGDMHKDIVKHFKNYYLFGFTGTPIFAANANKGIVIDNKGKAGGEIVKTTEQLFGDRLHTYTVVNAINDENVLPFKIDYVNTIKTKYEENDKIRSIDEEKALLDHDRIKGIAKYILKHFNEKTFRNQAYFVKDQRKLGFNSILCTDSITMAKEYYLEFKRQQKDNPDPLTVAIIYSYPQNEVDMEDNVVTVDESFNAESLDLDSRTFLDKAIEDYNLTFGTSYSTNGDSFYNYYKDVSQKMKDKEIDILIVVNMFLTGFDAKTLNTLWVDKNLQAHNLIQAYSRTNRILNSVKKFGNIVCFRNLMKETNEAISLFGDPNAKGVILLKSFNDYYHGYTDQNGEYVRGYEETISDFKNLYPLDREILGEIEKRRYIKIFGGILRLRNLLSAFDEFKGKEILTPIEYQDYTSIYLNLFDYFRGQNRVAKTEINDDLIFEIELVKQMDVNIDYILRLIGDANNSVDKELSVKINSLVDSSPQLRSKKELIKEFIKKINVNNKDSDTTEEWEDFIKEFKDIELNKIIEEEKLNKNRVEKYIETCMKSGSIKVSGIEIDNLLPPISRFSKGNESRLDKKARVIEKFEIFFERFYGV